MMIRKLAAVFAVLALASCFGRVSAWAAAPGDAHACCRGESQAPEQGPALAECCATPAAIGAVSTIRAALVSIVVETPALPAAPQARLDADQGPAPPGPQTPHSSVPARAPPLA